MTEKEQARYWDLHSMDGLSEREFAEYTVLKDMMESIPVIEQFRYRI